MKHHPNLIAAQLYIARTYSGDDCETVTIDIRVGRNIQLRPVSLPA